MSTALLIVSSMKVALVYLCALVVEQLRTVNGGGSHLVYPAWVSIDRKSSPTRIFLNILGEADFPLPLMRESPVCKALESFPLIDGHNDFPFWLYMKLQNNLTGFDFNSNLKSLPGWETIHTDLPRLKQGKVGGQFWSAFVFCETQYKDAVAKTLQQIDVIKRLVKKNFAHMQFVTTADGILEAFKEGKIASMIGIEGGHSIDARLGVLRMYYDLGVRYLTLTHTCSTPWSGTFTSAEKKLEKHSRLGLTNFGKKVVLEMNRLGMMVDIAHVSRETMSDALQVSIAPVIFSHSSVQAVYKHPRNVDDSILKLLQKNRGIIMINFYPGYIGGDDATLQTVAAHINHIVDLIGPDHVGLGSDFDGIPKTVKGLDDVSKYPDLLEAVFRSKPERWTQLNLEKLIGRNLVRVFREVEKVRDELVYAEPLQYLISDAELHHAKNPNVTLCRTKVEEGLFEKLVEELKDAIP